MFTYRSEPLRAWNWEEKSPQVGHGEGLKTEQGINFSSGSDKTYRARREISQREREQWDNHPKHQSWKIKTIKGGRSPQEWVTTAVTRHQHSHLLYLLFADRNISIMRPINTPTPGWTCTFPEDAPHSTCLSGITPQTQQCPVHISAQAAFGR